MCARVYVQHNQFGNVTHVMMLLAERTKTKFSACQGAGGNAEELILDACVSGATELLVASP